MKEKCPNCGQYKFSKSLSVREAGFVFLIIIPLIALFLVPASSEIFGGSIDIDIMSRISIFSIIIGVIVIIISYVSPQNEFTYECESCKYKEQRSNSL
jgi:predicted RNA-binding Zn-ribbon protein involved in translation (DUF1610 family)